MQNSIQLFRKTSKTWINLILMNISLILTNKCFTNGLTFQRAYYRERAYFSVFTVYKRWNMRDTQLSLFYRLYCQPFLNRFGIDTVAWTTAHAFDLFPCVYLSMIVGVFSAPPLCMSLFLVTTWAKNKYKSKRFTKARFPHFSIK